MYFVAFKSMTLKPKMVLKTFFSTFSLPQSDI